MKTLFLIFSILLFVAAILPERVAMNVTRHEKLSDYKFFMGDLKALSPADKVFPYSVNSPLFSNYAEKLRFIKLPEGAIASYNDSTVFDFPTGSMLIKNFYYPADFRNPSAGRRIIETRLLVKQEKGWEAWPYVWNDEQTEAYYDPAPDSKTIHYINLHGKKVSTTYAIPNKNQCKGCHVRNDKLVPIGPTSRQLNGDFSYPSGTYNQLAYWKEQGLLNQHPDVSKIKTLARWDDPSSGTLNDRARAYLDANCSHCHSKDGPAGTSGLFLDVYERNLVHLGIQKTPVAAGRGSGNLTYDIVPGKPEQSILLYRMKTNDPGIAMPEIGREQVHLEGVALIEEWIRKKSFTY